MDGNNRGPQAKDALLHAIEVVAMFFTVCSWSILPIRECVPDFGNQPEAVN